MTEYMKISTKEKKRKTSTSEKIIFTFLLVFSFLNLFPLLNMLLNSFRGNNDIIRNPIKFNNLSVQNYVKAQEFANLARGMVNGVIISGLTILLLVIIGAMSAYALSFIKVKGRGFLKAIITLGYFIPPGSVLINTFLVFSNINLANSYLGIVIIYGFIFTPITMIILTGYMKTIPYDIIESAMIDGSNHFMTYLRIILPMIKSAVVTLIILLFLWTYNEYMWPLIMMARPQKRTIAVVLTMFYDDRQQDFGMLSAAVIISIIPIMSVYIALKEKIIAGMAAGSVKG